MIKGRLPVLGGRVWELVFLLALIGAASAHAADSRELREEKKALRTSFERDMDQLERDERALRRNFEADKKALNQRCEKDETGLRDTHRRERNRLEREITALHERCREQRRALTQSFENRNRALIDRRAALRRSHAADVKGLRHPEGARPRIADGKGEPRRAPVSRDLPPGLERYEEKHGGKLPPGLQKQLEEKGHLPPGLEKR